MVNLLMLGTGGNVPSYNRFCSCLFVNYKGKKILIDCGEGTQMAMKRYGCGFKDVDLLLITHLHGDHINGMLGLLATMGNSDKRNPLTIVGPLGIKNAISAMMVLWENLPFRLRVIENPIGKFSIIDDVFREIEISTLELKHSTECLAYSLYFKRGRVFDLSKAEKNMIPKKLWKGLQSGRSYYIDDKIYTPDMVLGHERRGIKLSYITDTRPIESIVEFIDESDLFICEGTYGDDMDISKAVKNKHMTFREAATLAKRGNVDKLLITHFSPSIEDPKEYRSNATSVFKNTVIAYDGIRQNLSYKE